MKSVSTLTAATILVTMATSLRAEPQPPTESRPFPHRLVVDLVDGSTVIGTTTRASFPVRHETGDLSVKLRSIVSVTMQPDGGKAVVKLSNGDHFQVDWKMDSVGLQTAYGDVEVPASRIRQILVGNYTLSREPGAWTVLRTYDHGNDSVTERVHTDEELSLDKTTPKDGTDENILKEIVYDLDGGIRKVRYPTGPCYEFDGKSWTRTEPGAYQDLPNFDLSPYMPPLPQNKTVPIEKVTEGDMTFYRFTLQYPLKKAYKKGTSVAQHRSLGGYTYSAAAGDEVPTRWTKFEGVIRGESITKIFPGQFRRSTKYVRIMILPNYGQKGDYRLRFDALSFGDATRNENLITNHDASQGRQNLQASTVKGDGVGDRVCFEVGTRPYQLLSTEYIPVDTMKAYRISGWFRSAGSAGLSKLHYGVVCYDADKRHISSTHIGRVKDTFTELAIAAKPGDKVLHLKDAGKWQDDVSHVAAAFNVDSTPENTRIKLSTGAYDPALNKWQPDGGEAYCFEGAIKPRYVRKKDGTWINNLRPKEKGTYDPIADRWIRKPS